MGKCGCGNNHCNNSCKPVCDPCNKQPKILYCGRPVECLNIKRGDKLDDIIKTAGDKICQLQGDIDQVSYVNIEDATEEQCEYGGYVIQVLDLGSDNLIEEAIICNATPLTFQENGVEVSQALTVNFENSDTIAVSATHDIPSDTTTYVFDTVSTTNITWQEGIDLMDASLVIPNMLYYVTDRGWYLEGINSSNFSIDGYKIDRIPKETYYVLAGDVKGVWNTQKAPFSTGNIVIYGGKVWSSVAGNTGSAVDLFNLSNDWTLENGNTYYENKILKISVDYRDNWLFKQEDDRNNIISIPKVIYGSFGLNRVWADWNMPKLYDNETSLILNNSENKDLQISGNRGVGKITDNYSAVIRNNIIKSSEGIYKNKVSNITENVLINFHTNSGFSFTDNVFDKECSGNTILTTFDRNNCKGVVLNNTLPFVRLSRFNGDFSENSNENENVSAGIRDSFFGDGALVDNTFLNPGVEHSIIMDKVALANNVRISLSYVNFKGSDLSLNNNVTVSYSYIEDEFTSNQNMSLINVSAKRVDSNTDCSVENTTADEIRDNSNSIIQNNHCYDIINNSSCLIAENKVNGSINDNNLIEEISGNSNNGDISNNISSTLISTGIKISGNTNNGSIFFNTINNGVVINSNNNNGTIGTNAVPTVRAVSITGTVVNL